MPFWGRNRKIPAFSRVRNIARAVGVPAVTIDDPTQLEGNLGKAISSDGPYLLNVVMDPTVLNICPRRIP